MLGNESGQYFNLSEEVNWSSISSFKETEDNSLFLLTGRNPTSDSVVHVMETKSLEQSPMSLQMYKIPFILSDSKIFTLNNKTFLFAVGYEKLEKVGRESVFFFSNVELRSESSELKTNLKHKKMNLFALDHIDEKVYLLSDYAIYKYSLVSFDFDLFFEMYDKKPENKFTSIKTDSNNGKIFVTAGKDIYIFDHSNNSKMKVENCHLSSLSDFDINPFKQFQIATTAEDPFIKFWDVRNPRGPNMIFQDPSNLITSCSYNPSYDQLMLYSTVDGSLKLLLANSVSSLTNEDSKENTKDKLLKDFNNALNDTVSSCCWNLSSNWIFGGATRNQFYFGMVPQGVKYDVML
jgi:WD40 repeat protein